MKNKHGLSIDALEHAVYFARKTDNILQKLTWKGQPKSNSKKCSLATYESKLSMTVFGMKWLLYPRLNSSDFSVSLYSDSVKYGQYNKVFFKVLESLSSNFIRRASDCISSKKQCKSSKNQAAEAEDSQ